MIGRVIKHPKLYGIYLNKAKLETLSQEYKPKLLSGPSDKVRATFVLTRTTINFLKKHVSAQIPTLQYISSFTVACAYIWSCIAKSRNNELQVFGFIIDCRTRLVPTVPSNYFGNCLATCGTMAKTSALIEKDGFVTAAKLLGDCFHKKLNDKDGILKDAATWYDFS
ncbi:Chloramphenicol acetyltransferase-like domain-containing protein [Artemisia annua]|uniref:Chloramphenicol acetyltransferase-like domain-containing protein n=1 Tax=Artemisia annua TaxID=35608 RepID=A0A2U1MFQ2_ARTAN|nr:Chloramphenicol acetyltransferase-like domain-containing protein [Artemisia annua]